MDTKNKLFNTIDPLEIIADIQFEQSFQTVPHSSYSIEKYLIHYVSTGDVKGFDKMISESLYEGDILTIGKMSENPIRQLQYFAVAALTITSRVAINSGMNETEAYELSDKIIQKIDKLNTEEEIATELLNGIKKYIAIVHKLKKLYAHNKHIQQCINYIDEHIHDKITLDNLSKEISLNKTYISSLFKKITGKTISDYIFVKKIELAKQLLLEEKYSITDIATFLGFTTPSYFITIFKRFTGVTPSQWISNSMLIKK